MSTGVPTAAPGRPFGELLTAMVTPFTPDGALDVDAGVALAVSLVEQGCDGLVLAGTTGESPTTSPAEKMTLQREVIAAVGPGVTVMAGIGTHDTVETCANAREAAAHGAHGLLLVTPYYSRPSQAGLVAHFTTAADATDLPVMLYDIPARSVVAIEDDTVRRCAEHPRIVAMKDAKGVLPSATTLIAETGMAWYSGDDPINLPWLAIGAVGFVSVLSHVATRPLRAMLDAWAAGDTATATRINADLMPTVRAMTALGGVPFAKAALTQLGVRVGTPRLPLVEPSGEQQEMLAGALTASGLVRQTV